MTALFWSGSTSASISLMPRRRAMACAVVRLSPVSMTMRMPSARRASSAAGVDALTGSAMAMTAAALPSTPTKIAVAPSARSLSASAASARVSIPSSLRKLALPSATRLPSTVPSAPLPVGESKSLAAAERESCAVRLPRRWRRQAGARSPARRWRRAPAPSLRRSRLPARRRSPPGGLPSACRSCRRPACRPFPGAPKPRRS